MSMELKILVTIIVALQNLKCEEIGPPLKSTPVNQFIYFILSFNMFLISQFY